jgi:hypothetical protein
MQSVALTFLFLFQKIINTPQMPLKSILVNYNNTKKETSYEANYINYWGVGSYCIIAISTSKQY